MPSALSVPSGPDWRLMPSALSAPSVARDPRLVPSASSVALIGKSGHPRYLRHLWPRSAAHAICGRHLRPPSASSHLPLSSVAFIAALTPSGPAGTLIASDEGLETPSVARARRGACRRRRGARRRLGGAPSAHVRSTRPGVLRSGRRPRPQPAPIRSERAAPGRRGRRPLCRVSCGAHVLVRRACRLGTSRPGCRRATHLCADIGAASAARPAPSGARPSSSRLTAFQVA